MTYRLKIKMNSNNRLSCSARPTHAQRTLNPPSTLSKRFQYASSAEIDQLV